MGGTLILFYYEDKTLFIIVKFVVFYLRLQLFIS